MNASSVLGKTCRAQETADDAAYRKKVCQKQGAIQTAWEGVISGTRVTPKRVKKQGFQRPKEKGLCQPDLGESMCRSINPKLNEA